MEPIVKIKLGDKFAPYVAADGKKLSFLGNLSKLNIFVGPNNSGKSLMMRELARCQNYSVQQKALPLEIVDPIRSFAIRVKTELTGMNVIDAGDLPPFLMEQMLDPNEFHTYGIDTFEYLKKQLAHVIKNNGNIGNLNRNDGRVFSNYPYNLMNHVRELAPAAQGAVGQLPNYKDAKPPKRLYIPTLRGLRLLDENHTDFYKARTQSDYFKDTSSSPEIFTGMSLFEDLTDMLLGDHSKRAKIRAYEKLLSDKFFGGNSVTLIPYKLERVVAIKIGQEIERFVHDLGDGIQNIIVITYKVATQIDPAFFFIEELETHLHPGLQRKLLEFLMEFESHTFFLTTHSNHLLDMTLDYKQMTVFNFSKCFIDTEEDNNTASFIVEQLDSPSSSSLELLGAQDSSVFLVNATIWVEGITDRRYLRHMLELFQRHLLAQNNEISTDYPFAEDVHFSFVEYGGANITHWDFGGTERVKQSDSQISVERLCARSIVIVDGDGGKKDARHEKLLAVLGERLIVLPCREIENTLPPSVLVSVVLSYELQIPQLSSFKYADYKDKYLGKFIEESILISPRSRTGTYAESSGTLTQKSEFCERAIPFIDWKSLPPTTKAVLERIYNHISRMNTKKS